MNHKQQLVYFTKTEVTNLEPLVHSIATNDFKFFNAQGHAALSIKEVQD